MLAASTSGIPLRQQASGGQKLIEIVDGRKAEAPPGVDGSFAQSRWFVSVPSKLPFSFATICPNVRCNRIHAVSSCKQSVTPAISINEPISPLLSCRGQSAGSPCAWRVAAVTVAPWKCLTWIGLCTRRCSPRWRRKLARSQHSAGGANTASRQLWPQGQEPMAELHGAEEKNWTVAVSPTAHWPVPLTPRPARKSHGQPA
jgi:hypothetical protein